MRLEELSRVEQAFEFRGQGGGRTYSVVPRVRAQTNSGDSVRGLLLSGVGFGVLPRYQIAAGRESAVLGRLPGCAARP